MERLRESSQLRPLVINVGSDTFGNPIFSEGLTKLAKILDYKCPWPSFAAWSIIGPDFIRKVVLKWNLPKNDFNKKSYSSMKKNQKDSNDFLDRKFTLKVQF